MKYKILIYLFLMLLIVYSYYCSGKNKEPDQTAIPVLKGEFPGQNNPGNIPDIFAKGIVSTEVNEYSPTFSSDGKEMFFTRDVPHCAIMTMRQVNGVWTKPEIASFSGKYSEADPFLSPDGKKLFFGSNRPKDGKGDALKEYNIWLTERSSAGGEFEDPRILGPGINTKDFEIFSTVTGNGTIYFGTGGDIFRSEYNNGMYATPQKLSSSVNSGHDEVEPYISPDESFLIFTSYGRPDGLGSGDLYISFKNENGLWSMAKNLGEGINSSAHDQAPIVSPDGKFLFFTSNRDKNRKKDIYWVDAGVLKKFKQ